MTEDDIAAFVEGIAPVVRACVAEAIAPILRRQEAMEIEHIPVFESLKDVGAMRERLAVLETRPQVPGPPGPAGADGLGVEDLGVVQCDDRTFTITATHGDRVKDIGTVRLALDIYRGVWVEGRTYDPGDGVTCAGAEWHCHTTTTTKPGDGSKAWTLKVKRGKDGKDGKDGPPGPPGRDWQQVYDDTRKR